VVYQGGYYVSSVENRTKRLVITCGISRLFVSCFCRKSNQNDWCQPEVYQGSLYIPSSVNRTENNIVYLWHMMLVYNLLLSRIQPKWMMLTCGISKLFISCVRRESNQKTGFNPWYIKVVNILLLSRIETKCLVLTCFI